MVTDDHYFGICGKTPDLNEKVTLVSIGSRRSHNTLEQGQITGFGE